MTEQGMVGTEYCKACKRLMLKKVMKFVPAIGFICGNCLEKYEDVRMILHYLDEINKAREADND